MKFEMPDVNGQTRSVAIAFGGAILAATGTMLLPIHWLEAFTGATGISEMFPSTAAPLGDTARALMAFATGVLAFALLAARLSKRSEVEMKANPVNTVAPTMTAERNFADGADTVDTKPWAASLMSQLRGKTSELIANMRGRKVSNDSGDAPKLRTRDSHPDAPARRPISANRDFLELDNRSAAPYVPEIALPTGPFADLTVQPAAAEPDAAVALSEPEPQAAAVPSELSLAEMVEKLEAALMQRQAKLARLEAIAHQITSEAPSEGLPLAIPVFPADVEIKAEQSDGPDVNIWAERRLEAVEPTGSAIRPARNGDEALRSALETLHRMNARSA